MLHASSPEAMYLVNFIINSHSLVQLTVTRITIELIGYLSGIGAWNYGHNRIASTQSSTSLSMSSTAHMCEFYTIETDCKRICDLIGLPGLDRDICRQFIIADLLELVNRNFRSGSV